MMNGRYVHARQIRRAKREQKRLRTCLGRVIRESSARWYSKHKQDRNTHDSSGYWRLPKGFMRNSHDKDKVYSVHAPEVECTAKGKAHKPHEFGVKVGVVSTSKESFVVGMQSLPGNPYDGHRLKASLQQVQKLTGIAPKDAYGDRGYRGHGLAEPVKVWIARTKRGVTVAIRKKLKRRNAVEPVIGHMKNDGRLGRNFLKGIAGDAMNALRCCAVQATTCARFCAGWRFCAPVLGSVSISCWREKCRTFNWVTEKTGFSGTTS